MEEYKSSYTDSYINISEKGAKYDAKIENKFELFIWDLEKYFIEKISKRFIFDKKNVKYLDFACGTGRLLYFFKNELGFENVTGLDTSMEMINEARKKTSAEFICGNININKNLLSGRKFDLVTSFRLFLNLEKNNREKVLKELRNYISDSGYLICNNHVSRHSFLGFQFWLRKKMGNRRVINTETQAEFVKMLERNGFHVEAIYRFTFFPGRKKFIILPWKILKKVEIFLARIPLINYFCQSQIFVCKKAA